MKKTLFLLTTILFSITAIAQTTIVTPAQQKLNISVNSTQQTIFNYLIIDMYGRIVRKEIFTNPSVDVSQLSNGVYNFQLNSKNQQLVKRFVIVK